MHPTISILLLSLFLCVSARGATYYVDFAAGSDSANGTSSSTPWKHCKGDSNATGTAAGTTLTAGDVVNFKGGIIYTGQLAGDRRGVC